MKRWQLDELILRPGTYFNPATEIMVVVDDSPEVDHEVFEGEDLEPSDWVLIADESPLDEPRRDDLVEQFLRSHQEGATDDEDLDDDEDELEPDELDDEDEDLDELGLEYERD